MILLHANNKGTDHPVHPHSLISAFVIILLESNKSKLATCKIQYSRYISLSNLAG